MKALTVKQPWAWAIAGGVKNIENRTWAVARHSGLLAIHAGAQIDKAADFGWIAEQCGVSTDYVKQMCETRSRVVAVVNLAYVCTSGVAGDCGPWSLAGHKHWGLTNAHMLPTFIPATGRLGLWDLPADVEAAVIDQIHR